MILPHFLVRNQVTISRFWNSAFFLSDLQEPNSTICNCGMTFFLEKKFDSLGFFSIMMAFFNESHLFDMVSSHANIKGRIIRLIIHRSQINCSEVVETT